MWISVHDGVADHPKTRKLARALRCSRHEALGILVALWQWGLHNADRDGKIINATEDDISDGIFYRPSYGQSRGQSSDTGAETEHNPSRTLLRSLIDSGWIDDGGDGSYYLHDWEEWQAEWFKYNDRKDAEKRRKREERERERELKQNAAPPPDDVSYGQSRGQSSDTGADSTHITEQYNTEQNIIKDSGGKPPLHTPSDGGEEVTAPTRSDPVPFTKIQDLYNTLCVRLPKIESIEGNRRKAVVARYKTHGMAGLKLLFENAAASDFLAGGGQKGFVADFDWLVAATNMQKVMEGKYANRTPPLQPSQNNGSSAANRNGVNTMGLLDGIINGGGHGLDG